MFNQSIKQVKDYELQSIDSLSNKSIAESEAQVWSEAQIWGTKWWERQEFYESFQRTDKLKFQAVEC